MKPFFKVALLAAAFTGLVACTANTSGSDDTTSTDDALSAERKAACVDITTLTCKSGYESTEEGCAQSHVYGAHPQGRCEKIPSTGGDACVDIETLDCKKGYAITEDGCAQSRVEGATPMGRCEKTAN